MEFLERAICNKVEVKVQNKKLGQVNICAIFFGENILFSCWGSLVRPDAENCFLNAETFSCPCKHCAMA